MSDPINEARAALAAGAAGIVTNGDDPFAELDVKNVEALRKVKPLADALAGCLATYHKWLELPDDDVVLAALASVAANLLPGDPFWMLLVGSPGSGKTEVINPLDALPYVHAAATLTEAGMLSGTPRKEQAKDAKGGLLRSVGDFGIIMSKDFSGVLSMNRDARAATLSALREVYDGSWTRHVGSDGGRMLAWRGKAGFVGAVTPSIDAQHSVMGALGERFTFYRVHVDDPKAQARRRLANRGRERQMRAELVDAVCDVLDRVDRHAAPRPLDVGEINMLVDLAAFVVSARTAVERDGYTRDVTLMPSVEAPGRLVGALGALVTGLEAIGADAAAVWRIVLKVGWDCIPDLRHRVLDAVHAERDATAAQIMTITGIPKTTCDRTLEDLVLLDLVQRDKRADYATSPWWYALTDHAIADWPASPEMFITYNAHRSLIDPARIEEDKSGEAPPLLRGGAG